MNLQNRSYQKELLDEDNIPFEDIRLNMQELNRINTLSGGHDITIAGFKTILCNRQKITVCEIGCGGGDNLTAIKKWCDKKQVSLRCIGIDLKEECIQFARASSKINDVKWITSDYAKVGFDEKPDIIFSSLFCHHFTDDELVDQVKWMKENSSAGFFINDLHRSSIAYHFIRIVTKLFSSSYLVKNDAPISVSRGFRKKDWEQVFANAGITGAVIQWKWAFRYLVTWKNENNSQL